MNKQLYHYEFHPWTVRGERRIVASDAEWNHIKMRARIPYLKGEQNRFRILIGPDLFEDSGGFLYNSAGAVIYQNREHAMSLSDVRRRFYDLIDRCPNVDWIVRTQWPERIAEWEPEVTTGYESGGPQGWISDEFRPNVWYCVPIRTQSDTNRLAPKLLAAPAAVRGVWCEPEEEINLYPWLWTKQTAQIDWIVATGNLDYANSLVKQAKSADVPCWCESEDVRQLPT